MITAWLREPVLHMLTFEIAMQACDGEGRYCYLQAHSLPKFSIPTLRFNPADETTSATQGQT